MKHEPDALAKREKSEFLAVANHDGESLDFHSLRHTRGLWLPLQAVHPTVIKTILRHASITLTMDTYGHLLPDQHAKAVGRIANILAATPLQRRERPAALQHRRCETVRKRPDQWERLTNPATCRGPWNLRGEARIAR